MKHPALFLSCAVGLLLAPALSHADKVAPAGTTSWSQSATVEPEPEPEQTKQDLKTEYRKGKGWFVSGDVGVGGVAASFADGSGDRGAQAGFFHLRFGGMIKQRLGVSVELWSDGYDDEIDFGPDERFVQNTVALAVSYWASPRIWVTGGLGSASLHDYSSPVKVTNDGAAYMVGMGLEVWRRPKYSLDLTFRLITSSYDVGSQLNRTSAGFGVGATWH